MNQTRIAAEESTNLTSPSDPETILRCVVCKVHRGGKSDFLLDVAFDAPPGFTILFGSSGSGKTTLLDCIAGLTAPDSGKISIGNRVLFDASQRINIPLSQRRTGYVLQSLALFPHMTVIQNVAYGLAHLSDAERKQRTTAMLEAFHIAHLAQRSAREISGGEAQRVALARTLVTEPEV